VKAGTFSDDLCSGLPQEESVISLGPVVGPTSGTVAMVEMTSGTGAVVGSVVEAAPGARALVEPSGAAAIVTITGMTSDTVGPAVGAVPDVGALVGPTSGAAAIVGMTSGAEVEFQQQGPHLVKS